MAITNEQGKLILVNSINNRVRFDVTNNILSSSGIVLDINIVTTNLLNWYSLEEGNTNATGAFKDKAYLTFGVGDNPGNNLTKSGTTTQVAGFYGNTIDMSGDDTITNDTTGGVTGNGARTVQFWAKVTSSATTNSTVTFGGNNSSSNQGWTVMIFPQISNDSWSIQGNGGGNDTTIQTAGVNFTNGSWHNLAASWDAGSTIKFYVDGALTNTLTFSHTYATKAGFGIGALLGNTCTTTIDEVLVYSTNLSDAAVLQNYNAFF